MYRIMGLFRRNLVGCRSERALSLNLRGNEFVQAQPGESEGV